MKNPLSFFEKKQKWKWKSDFYFYCHFQEKWEFYETTVFPFIFEVIFTFSLCITNTVKLSQETLRSSDFWNLSFAKKDQVLLRILVKKLKKIHWEIKKKRVLLKMYVMDG